MRQITPLLAAAVTITCLLVFQIHSIAKDSKTVRLELAQDDKIICLNATELLDGPRAYQERANVLLAKHAKAAFLHLPSPPDQPYSLNSETEINGEHGQALELEKILKNKTSGFFLECGAADGEKNSNTLFLEMRRNWTGLLVEPNRKLFQDLLSKKRKAYAVEACLSIRPYAEKLAFLGAEQVGGLMELPPTIELQNFRNDPIALDVTFSDTVQCFPLHALLLALGNPVVDFFSLDVEMAEEKVLENIPWDRVDIRVIMVEVQHSDARVINVTMAKNGYEMIKNMKNQDYIYVKKGLVVV